jgi:electron transfer flavoprotein beta subunit
VSSTGTPETLVVACLKLVELRAGVDPLTGTVLPDPLSAAMSPADSAALELALRAAEAWRVRVLALSAGLPRSDAVLRGALAAGASSARRIPLDPAASSAAVAKALASAIAGEVARSGRSAVLVFCGDASFDRGTGSVPAFLAGELEAAQALGAVEVALGESPQAGLVVKRRLDGGRREVLSVLPPAVVSVEGGVARLRRAALPSLASAATQEVLTVQVPNLLPREELQMLGEAPYKPRARVVPAPAGASPRERIVVLTGAAAERQGARTVVADPVRAAGEILAALAAWGELPAGLTAPSQGAAPAGPQSPGSGHSSEAQGAEAQQQEAQESEAQESEAQEEGS